MLTQDSFTVVILDLKTTTERPVSGPPSKTLAAAVKKARSLTDGGLMHGPTNEVRVLDAASVVLHRFRKLTHGSLGGRGGSFSARPCEVDERGRLGTTVRIFGVAARPEVGDAIVAGMFDRAREEA